MNIAGIGQMVTVPPSGLQFLSSMALGLKHTLGHRDVAGCMRWAPCVVAILPIAQLYTLGSSLFEPSEHSNATELALAE